MIAFYVTESFLSLNGINKRDMGSGRSDPRAISSDPTIHNNFSSFMLQEERSELPSSLAALRVLLNTLGKERIWFTP